MHLDAPILAIRFGSESSILLRSIFTEISIARYFLLFHFFRMLCASIGCVRLSVVCVYRSCARCTTLSPRSSVIGAPTTESGVGIVVFLHNFLVTITALFSNQWPIY